MAGRMGSQMIAVVAEGKKGRVYLPPTPEQEMIAKQAEPQWLPNQILANDPRNIWCVGYGLNTFDKLFTSRQLVTLTTFSDLVQEARERILSDASIAGLVADQAYADAVATYLGMNVSKLSNRCAAVCFWDTTGEKFNRCLHAKQFLWFGIL